MSDLWRCDVCMELIDPVEGDERAVLGLKLDVDGQENETATVDLCENCRPSSLASHVDWLTFQMEGDNEQ